MMLEAMPPASAGAVRFSKEQLATLQRLGADVEQLFARTAEQDAKWRAKGKPGVANYPAYITRMAEEDFARQNGVEIGIAKEIATGIVDGTNLLVMDMDKCIRCGNCSMACHKIHGQSRLLRHGIHIARPVKPNGRSIQHVLMPSVCLHCQDPECLTGCPTGAIARFECHQFHQDSPSCFEPKNCI
jgi:ferredoxin